MLVKVTVELEVEVDGREITDWEFAVTPTLSNYEAVKMAVQDEYEALKDIDGEQRLHMERDKCLPTS